jgi:hypothetical protein
VPSRTAGELPLDNIGRRTTTRHVKERHLHRIPVQLIISILYYCSEAVGADNGYLNGPPPGLGGQPCSLWLLAVDVYMFDWLHSTYRGVEFGFSWHAFVGSVLLGTM